ncbi:acyl-CoA dehydrogenase [bacterium]|nr:MAG: acyl-CoA dehydrogenase [bacterium]
MKFSLTSEQELIQKTAREFAAKEIAPFSAEWDREARFPKDVVKKLADLGFLGMNVAPEHGGAGMDTLSYILAVEEISRGDAAVGVIMSVNNSLVCWPIDTYGTPEQKERWLAPLARGEHLGAYCLSEPQAGTDAAAQKATAKKTDKGWVLNGTKNFITNGASADTLVVMAMTDIEAGHKGISAFIVDAKASGVGVAHTEKKMGIRASDTAQITLDDVELGEDGLLGKVGKGFGVAMSTLDGGRIGIAAQALGIGQAALDHAISYAREREQFGKPIGKFQAIQFKIADMAMRLDGARLLTYRAAWTKDQTPKHSVESAMAKYMASTTAVFCAEEAVQIFGGNGYSKEYPVEKLMRDAKICDIYEGTNEVQKMVVGATMLA